MYESFPDYAGIQDLGTDFGAYFMLEFTYLGLSFHNEYLHAVLEISNCPLAPHGLNLLGAS